jgi:hypothetical protein
VLISHAEPADEEQDEESYPDNHADRS